MTNEWLEFKSYTDTPVFLAESKQSTAFIGRFTVRMIKQNKGFNRIFTVLARGYLFHNADGTLRPDVPYERIERATPPRISLPGGIICVYLTFTFFTLLHAE